MIGIYKITSPSGKVYVGQSLDINVRFNAMSENATARKRKGKTWEEIYGKEKAEQMKNKIKKQ